MLEEYRRFLSRMRKLSRDEEISLWKLYKENDSPEARKSLIEHYQMLVFKEAVRFALPETTTLDLIQEGTVGLMEAAETYDWTAGTAFSLYAMHRIRGRMIDFLHKEGMEQLLPSDAQENMYGEVPLFDAAFEDVDKNSLHAAVNHAVNLLPDREKAVIRSIFLDEQTASETAEAMAVSTSYVYRLQKKGIHRLRGMLSRLIHDRR